MKKLISFTEAINNTFQQIMEKDSSVICFGLGVDDPKAIFNSLIIFILIPIKSGIY